MDHPQPDINDLPEMEVLTYSGLDDTLYLAWGGRGRHLAAVPGRVIKDEDPTPLGNRLRALGMELEPERDPVVAARLRHEYDERLSDSSN